MNKPKLKNITLTVDNYRDYLKIGDKVWVEWDDRYCGVAVVTEFDDSPYTSLPVWAEGDSNEGWPSMERIYLIDNETSEETSEQTDTKQSKSMKIRIKDEEHSRLVQETLFGMGYRWTFGQDVCHIDSEVLWTDDWIITHSRMDSFNAYPNEEVELVASYSLKPVQKTQKQLQIEALQKQIDTLQEQLNELKND